jgi:hypothetical protein
VRLALWGFEPCSGADGRVCGGRQGPEPAGASVRVWCEALWARRYGRVGEPMQRHEACGVVAGGEPADRIGIGAVGSPSHDVSILSKAGLGVCLG